MNEYDVETDEYIRHGLRLFQYGMLADTEEEHCRIQWEMMNSPKDKIIVDMGSGIGTFALFLSKLSPSLKIFSVTNSKRQHEIQQREFVRKSNLTSVLSDFRKTPIQDNSVDIVTFNESIGYAPYDESLAEVYRILKPGGMLYVKDFSRYGKNMMTEGEEWKYRFCYSHEIISAAERQGLFCDLYKRLNTSFSRFVTFWESSLLMQMWHPRRFAESGSAFYVFQKMQ